MTTTYPIGLHVYDISGGMAKQFSLMFVGKQIDAIYHTGILAFGKEYYFGGGICHGIPGQTPYGNPIKREELGTTEINKETFEEYLETISQQFSMESYDLFNNNCNNFTDEVAKFLVGKGIPDYISGLPNEILNTPFGQMIKPIVDGLTKSVQQAGQQMLPTMFEGQNNTQAMFAQQQQQQQSQQQYQQQQQTSSSLIKEMKNLDDFMQACETNLAIVIDCYSNQCPPCLTIKPIYQKLAEEYSTKCPELRFYSADVNVATDVSESLDVQKIPTFFFYKGYDLITQFSGADENNLRTKVQDLVNEIQKK